MRWGDGLFGPATVVEGIRDGKKAAEAIIGRDLSEDIFKMSDEEVITYRKGNLAEEDESRTDSGRCLSCNSYCENCMEVCPQPCKYCPCSSGHGEASDYPCGLYV